MRTAAEFNRFYAVEDPWQVSQARFRHRVYRRFLPQAVSDRDVLELGCGEGHMTEMMLGTARAVTAVDISNIAIARASARRLPNAQFKTADFMQIPFEGYDVIAALECIYYLSPPEQDAFFAKVAEQHRGKTLILSGPIIGDGQHRRYFTHPEMVDVLDRHGMRIETFRNIVINRHDVVTSAVAAAARIAPQILDLLPTRMIFQRCYLIKVGG
jgi:SAM-dependent methyltransferase